MTGPIHRARGLARPLSFREDSDEASSSEATLKNARDRRREEACAILIFGFAAGGCSIPIDDQLWRCSTAADCGAGWQCDPTSRRCVEAYDGSQGLFDDRLVVGMSASFSDAIPALAVISEQMLTGIEAYFRHINSSGGLHGRRLEVVTVNDGYDPAKTTENLEQLMGARESAREIFLACNTLGTPTSLAAADVAVRQRMLLWAPGTGFGQIEPDPPNRYVFNFRPRFSDEAEQVTEYLLRVIEPNTPRSNIAVLAEGFDDQGTLNLTGDDFVEGVSRSLGAPPSQVPYGTYVFNSTDVTEASRRLLKWMASEEREVTDGRRYVGLALGTVWDVGSTFIKTDPSHARRSIGNPWDSLSGRIALVGASSDAAEPARPSTHVLLAPCDAGCVAEGHHGARVAHEPGRYATLHAFVSNHRRDAIDLLDARPESARVVREDGASSRVQRRPKTRSVGHYLGTAGWDLRRKCPESKIKIGGSARESNPPRPPSRSPHWF